MVKYFPLLIFLSALSLLGLSLVQGAGLDGDKIGDIFEGIIPQKHKDQYLVWDQIVEIDPTDDTTAVYFPIGVTYMDSFFRKIAAHTYFQNFESKGQFVQTAKRHFKYVFKILKMLMTRDFNENDYKTLMIWSKKTGYQEFRIHSEFPTTFLNTIIDLLSAIIGSWTLIERKEFFDVFLNWHPSETCEKALALSFEDLWDFFEYDYSQNAQTEKRY